MSFMFESSTISIISKITIKTIIKTTKIEIELIEKELMTKIATKSIKEEFTSDEKKKQLKKHFQQDRIVNQDRDDRDDKNNWENKRNKRDKNDNERINDEFKLKLKIRLRFKFKNKIAKWSRIAHRWFTKRRNFIFVCFFDTRFAIEFIDLITKKSKNFRVTIEL